ncbi:MAG: Maf family protein [Armatimonadetes bacterium]|nr:Maf family protein [Armatimonadota bacterium]
MSVITLASASPRRAELIRLLGVEHRIVPSLLVEEEAQVPLAHPEAYVRALSMLKAEEVAERVRDGVILAADTVVALKGEILGKPKDVADAARMLNGLRGRTHKVFTGIALVRCEDGIPTLRSEDHVETDVHMRPFSDQTLHAYLDTGEPMDKAGAYGIQGKGALLVEGIIGDYYNVVGLPIGRVAEMLEAFGIRCL